ncbi:hypothetical protein [Spirillospora sp. CA-294931]|uniref:hypothetical protein n=1 Tax=Spirillospora sp. CA-294931 TaxID=3240042 RepID=UPI003D8CB7A2
MPWALGNVPRPGTSPNTRPVLYLDIDGVLRTGVMQIAETRKWAPILRHANGRRFAWLDDVIPFRLKRQAWPHRGILLIRVDPWTGLTERHVSRLHRWA